MPWATSGSFTQSDWLMGMRDLISCHERGRYKISNDRLARFFTIIHIKFKKKPKLKEDKHSEIK